MTSQLLGRMSLPMAVVLPLYAAALTTGGWWQVGCITALALLAGGFWLLSELGSYVETAWKPMAQEAITTTQVQALYVKESAEFSANVLSELARHDRDAATIMAGRLRDLSAKYEELL